MALFALRTTNPEGLAAMIAQRRVERGIPWLNTVRPHDWWRNLFRGSYLRAQDRYGNECVLALAFEHERFLRCRTHGYVSCSTVSDYYRLNDNWLRTHGFATFGKRTRNLNAHVTSELLDKTWKRALRESPLILRRVPVYPKRSKEAFEKHFVNDLMLITEELFSRKPRKKLATA